MDEFALSNYRSSGKVNNNKSIQTLCVIWSNVRFEHLNSEVYYEVNRVKHFKDKRWIYLPLWRHNCPLRTYCKANNIAFGSKTRKLRRWVAGALDYNLVRHRLKGKDFNKKNTCKFNYHLNNASQAHQFGTLLVESLILGTVWNSPGTKVH